MVLEVSLSSFQTVLHLNEAGKNKIRFIQFILSKFKGITGGG